MIAHRFRVEPSVPWPRVFGPNWGGAGEEKRGLRFPAERRSVLIRVLQKQGRSHSEALQKLADERSVTVTTGQQIGLGLGPLYTVLKIADAMAVAQGLEERWGIPVVPVFWMATEDHDAQEINHFWLGSRKFSHSIQPALHPVGGLAAHWAIPALEEAIEGVSGWQEKSILADWLRIYKSSSTLSEAVKKLVFRYFDPEKLLVLDPSDPELKAVFQPALLQEVESSIVSTAWEREKNRFPYAPERAIVPQAANVFLLQPNGERRYSGDREELLHAAENEPHRLSPNALLRPVYQEWILPNVVYVGGPGEAVYWNQLPEAFDRFQVPLPAFKLRSGATWLSASAAKAWKKSGLSWNELMTQTPEPRRSLQDAAEKQIQSRWEEWKLPLKTGMDRLEEQADRMHPELKVMAAAWRARMEREQLRWEEHARRWAKQHSVWAQDRIELVLDEVLPEGIPQERRWTALWAETQGGRHFAANLVSALNPWESEHLVIIPDESWKQ